MTWFESASVMELTVCSSIQEEEDRLDHWDDYRCETKRHFITHASGEPVMIAVWIEICTWNEDLGGRIVLEPLYIFFFVKGFGV